MGRLNTVGSNFSTRLPYERGACASGLSSTTGVCCKTELAASCEVDEGSLAGVLLLGEGVANRLLVVGLGSARRGYVVLIDRCWHSRQVANADDRAEGLRIVLVTVRSSIVPSRMQGRVIGNRELCAWYGLKPTRCRESLFEKLAGNFVPSGWFHRIAAVIAGVVSGQPDRGTKSLTALAAYPRLALSTLNPRPETAVGKAAAIDGDPGLGTSWCCQSRRQPHIRLTGVPSQRGCAHPRWKQYSLGGRMPLFSCPPVEM